MSEPPILPEDRPSDEIRFIACSLFVALNLVLLATFQNLVTHQDSAPAVRIARLHGQPRIQGVQAPQEAVLTDAPERIVFTGRISKRKVSNPKVLGGNNTLLNSSNHEYRVMSVTCQLDRSRARPGESIESDIGIAIIGDGQKVSLTSGEEMLVVHDYFVPTSPPLCGLTKPESAVQSLEIPSGGFRFAPGKRLSIGSVSALVPLQQAGVTEIDQQRLADGEFMALSFTAELVRADLVPQPAVTSYRSPYRDRNYVADPCRRYAPHTDFRNVTQQPVPVYGIGVFLSNLTSVVPTAHALEVAVNGRKVADFPLPAHIPGQGTKPLPLMLPLRLQLQPCDCLSVRGRIEPHQTMVFDFAAYIIGGIGLEQASEQLDLVKADFNGDGYPDIVDRDANGSLWVSIRVPGGFQETQDEKIRHLPQLDQVEARDLNGDGVTDLLVSNKRGFRQRLIFDPTISKFRSSYLTDLPNNPEAGIVWGDFNGDGWPDRLRVDHQKLQYLVSLGGINGLDPETAWLTGTGKVDSMFASDHDGDGKTDLLLQWSERGGLKSIIVKSDGNKLLQGDTAIIASTPPQRPKAPRRTTLPERTASAQPRDATPSRF